MKIIIAGDGKVGSTLTKELAAEGHDITLIDAKASVLELSEERYDVMVVQGNCASMAVLSQAGVQEAELLIAMTGADEVNMLCCTTAHVMNPKIHTIARIRNPEYTDQIYEMRSLFGLSMMVNPEKMAAIEMWRLIKYPGFLKRDTFAKGRVEIVELRIREDSKLCNASLYDLGNIVKCKILVCAVLRNSKAIIPDGNFTLQAGDRIFVTADSRELTLFLKNMGIITHKAKRVLLCGGGKLSYYLAQILVKDGIMVEIIEQDHDRCLSLANQLPDVTVVHGDASSEFLLESEGISDCDALVTLTGLDEMNIIISLYGGQCNVPQIITKLGRLNNNSILDTLSLGSIISPKELCCNSILRYVRAVKNQTGAAQSVHVIADGQAEAIEFIVDENTMYQGQPLKDLKIKKNVRVVSITKGAKYELPSGDSYFTKGNTVIIVTGRDEVIYQLNDIFE
ncbi:MAG: Trk system potassium transporter TrkA [Lachnospiraceae bacterium]|nr:Trk system potassium transporter TrkA [Lachnospiraceae bacterium]MDD6628936.1 Trk system potassium transporter TrkA [Lachnospiraceae bacterium]